VPHLHTSLQNRFSLLQGQLRLWHADLHVQQITGVSPMMSGEANWLNNHPRYTLEISFKQLVFIILPFRKGRAALAPIWILQKTEKIDIPCLFYEALK